MQGFHPIARLNGAKQSARNCAAAMAALESGRKYKGKAAASQVAKWCDDKGATAIKRCAEARERKAQGKGTYRLRNVDNQIAAWCSVAGGVEAAKAGTFTPQSPAEIVDELMWDDPDTLALPGSGDLEPLESGGKTKLLLPLAAGGLALGIIVIGVLASR